MGSSRAKFVSLLSGSGSADEKLNLGIQAVADLPELLDELGTVGDQYDAQCDRLHAGLLCGAQHLRWGEIGTEIDDIPALRGRGGSRQQSTELVHLPRGCRDENSGRVLPRLDSFYDPAEYSSEHRCCEMLLAHRHGTVLPAVPDLPDRWTGDLFQKQRYTETDRRPLQYGLQLTGVQALRCPYCGRAELHHAAIGRRPRFELLVNGLFVPDNPLELVIGQFRQLADPVSPPGEPPKQPQPFHIEI